MRSLVFATLAMSIVLSACATTPRQKCEAPYRAELRNVQTEIRETERALARGFVLVPATFSIGLHHCVRPSGAVFLCTADEGEPMYDKRAVNRAAEQAKLAALQAQLAPLEAKIAACQAQYPE